MQPSWVFTGNDVNPSNLVDNGRLTYDDTAKLMSWKYDGFNVSGDVTKNQNHYYSEEYKQYKRSGFYYDDVTINTGDNSIIDDSVKGFMNRNKLLINLFSYFCGYVFRE